MNWKKILLAALILIVLDATYLFVRKNTLQNQIEKIQQNAPIKLRFSGVLLCYVALVVGWYYFILRPHRSIYEAGLLGAVIYGVYETTNWASLRDWQASTLIIDTLWGAALFALSTQLFYLFTKS
jgi:uncharacterized membrane protein